MHKNSVYWKWIRSYLVLLVLTVLLLTGVFGGTYYHMKKQVMQANAAAVSTITVSMDSIFDTTSSTAIKIFLEDEMKNIADELQSDFPDVRLDIHAITKSLQGYKTSCSFFRSLGIYYPSADYIIADDSASSAKYLYKNYPIAATEDDSLKKWATTLIADQNGFYMSGDNLLYVQSFPVSVDNPPILLIVIDGYYLQQLIKHQDFNKNKIFAIADINNKLLFASEETKATYAADELKNILANEEIGELRKNFEVIQNRSSNRSITYICGIRRKDYYAPLLLLFGLGSIGFLLLVFCYSGLAIYYSRKHYRPIRQILEKYGVMQSSIREDELQIIGAEYEKMSSAVSLIENEYRVFAFNYLVVTNLQLTNGRNNISEIFQNFNVRFEFPFYIAAVWSIYDIKGISDDVILDEQEMEARVKPILQSVIQQETKNEGAALLFTVRPDIYLILFGISQENNNIKEKIATIQNWLQGENEFYGSMIVSKVFRQLDELPEVYRNQISAGYMLRFNDADILYCDEYSEVDQFRPAPLVLERKFLDSVLQGETDACDIMKQYIDSFELPLEYGREQFSFVKYSVCGLLSKALERSELSQYNVELLKSFLQMRESNLQKLKDFAYERIIWLQKQIGVQNNTSGERRQLVSSIKEYVQSHLSDENLSVNELGNIFHLNANYLSRLFKLQTGELLKDYILNIRIEQAKMLLKTTEYKIAEIAKKVGFIEITSFNRRFKQYTGMSPGQYRKID